MREKSTHRLHFIFFVDTVFNTTQMLLNSKFIAFAHLLMIPYCQLIFLFLVIRDECVIYFLHRRRMCMKSAS